MSLSVNAGQIKTQTAAGALVEMLSIWPWPSSSAPRLERLWRSQHGIPQISDRYLARSILPPLPGARHLGVFGIFG
jgi:hypothetical protein